MTFTSSNSLSFLKAFVFFIQVESIISLHNLERFKRSDPHN